MRSIEVLLLVSVCALTSTPSASAAISAFWQRNTITPQAITNDPTLANMQSWSLITSYDIGNWASAVMRATLPAGSFFYQHPLGSNNAPLPALIALFPGLEFDTYVADPTREATIVLGGHPASPTPSFGGPNDFIPGTFSVSLGNLVNDPPGTFEIARLTFPLGVLPTILQGPPPDARSNSSTVNPPQEANLPQIPEPSLGLAALALALHRPSPGRPQCRKAGRQFCAAPSIAIRMPRCGGRS
jgi:hypothetical protein